MGIGFGLDLLWLQGLAKERAISMVRRIGVLNWVDSGLEPSTSQDRRTLYSKYKLSEFSPVFWEKSARWRCDIKLIAISHVSGSSMGRLEEDCKSFPLHLFLLLLNLVSGIVVLGVGIWMSYAARHFQGLRLIAAAIRDTTNIQLYEEDQVYYVPSLHVICAGTAVAVSLCGLWILSDALEIFMMIVFARKKPSKCSYGSKLRREIFSILRFHRNVDPDWKVENIGRSVKVAWPHSFCEKLIRTRIYIVFDFGLTRMDERAGLDLPLNRTWSEGHVSIWVHRWGRSWCPEYPTSAINL